MNTELENKFPEIEILRGLAIIGVVLIHVSAAFTNIDHLTITLVIFASIDSFSHFAIPLFIFISGFVLYSKYNVSFNIFSFYKKRFVRVLPPYLIFSLLYLPLNYISLNPFKINIENLWIILLRLLTASLFYHLWFFGLIFQF